MKKRPTRKALVILLVGAILFIGASTAQAGWLFVLAAAVIGLAVGSMLVQHSVDRLQIVRSAPRRLRVGDDAALRIEVQNSGRIPLGAFRLEEGPGAFDPAASLCEGLGSGDRASFERTARALRRGIYPSVATRVVYGAPFGLAVSRRTVDVDALVTVVPRWVDLRSFPILEPSSFPFETLHERARTGAGAEFMGVREYRPGDPRRAVHWRSTARAGRLVVREYQEETASRVAIALTGPDHGEPPDSAFEALVSAAASIARYALVTGHPIELLGSDGAGGVTLSGNVDAESALDWLASADPAPVSPEELAEAALKRVSRRGTVVLMAPVPDCDLQPAVRLVQGAGSRAIAVVAASWKWDEKVGSGDDAVSDLASLATVRVIDDRKDLARCLQG